MGPDKNQRPDLRDVPLARGAAELQELVRQGADVLPDTADLLDLINRPELLELRNKREIHQLFERGGYKEGCPGGVTIGYGTKVGDDYSDAATSAIFVSREGEVLHVGSGTSGKYFMEEMGNLSEIAEPGSKVREKLEEAAVGVKKYRLPVKFSIRVEGIIEEYDLSR